MGFNYGARNFRRVKKSLMTAINAGVALSFTFWIFPDAIKFTISPLAIFAKVAFCTTFPSFFSANTQVINLSLSSR
ncbi:MAG: hypothetical protein ACFNVI_00890 [Lachnoanaerobaculum gingivalis]